MVIANPIFDVVFKRMMENERVAKFFIGTLLEQNIEYIEVKPQEFTYADEKVGIAVFRLDFIATITTEDGHSRKILIEIQKAKNQIDLMRFRNYLAEQYKKEDLIANEKTILPITTIYILGFTIPEIESACIKVERMYKDLIEKKTISQKSDFVEKLTHDSFVVQVDRISNRYQTRLDKLLSIFEQTNFLDDRKITKEFSHIVDSEELKITTDLLHHAGTNPQERLQIEIEQEAWRSINAMFEEKEKNYKKELEQSKLTIQEKERALEENEKALEEKERALEEKENEIEELKRQLAKK